MTNEEKVLKLMNFSRSGGLMQAFVLLAIEEYARLVIREYESGPHKDVGIVSGEAWYRCAQEVVESAEKSWYPGLKAAGEEKGAGDGQGCGCGTCVCEVPKGD